MPNETAPPSVSIVPVPDIASAIDHVLNLNGRRNDVTVQGHPGDFSVAATPDADGKMQTRVHVHTPPTPSTGDAGRLHDNGVVISSEVEKLQTTLMTAEANLSAIRSYDPTTGQPIYVYPQGSPERAMAETHLQRLRSSVAFSLQQFNRLQTQRDADAAKVNAADREKALFDTYTRGDPARVATLKAALADAEASEVAAMIVSARKAGR